MTSVDPVYDAILERVATNLDHARDWLLPSAGAGANDERGQRRSLTSSEYMYMSRRWSPTASQLRIRPSR